MNMYRSKRGASVGRAELAKINADRDARAFYAEESARMLGADGPVSYWHPNGTAEHLPWYHGVMRTQTRASGERDIAERARKAQIRMLADQIEHLKFITRGY